MNDRVNPVDTHDWSMIPAELNATCRACGIELMPPFRGVNPLAVEACPDRAPAPIPHDGSATSVVKDSLTTADTTQEKT
jgi:hypothetical protein